jgi:hypothetical protein
MFHKVVQYAKPDFSPAKQDKKTLATRPFSFLVVWANAQNVLQRKGRVAITTLGAKTSVPYAGIRGRHASTAHRPLLDSQHTVAVD